MKKVWIGLFVVVAAYACGDTAGENVAPGIGSVENYYV